VSVSCNELFIDYKCFVCRQGAHTPRMSSRQSPEGKASITREQGSNAQQHMHSSAGA
jgi:hypothetical protein